MLKSVLFVLLAQNFFIYVSLGIAKVEQDNVNMAVFTSLPFDSNKYPNNKAYPPGITLSNWFVLNRAQEFYLV